MITPSIYLEDTFLKQEVNTLAYPNCFEEGATQGTYLDYRGVRVVGNTEPIKGTTWCIIAEVDADEAFGANIRLRNNYLIFGGILMTPYWLLCLAL